MDLVGREPERARLASLVAAARSGTSGVLVVTGPAGIGKTALLRAALRDPPGFDTVAVECVEPEADLAYSALHLLLAPFVPPEQPLLAQEQQALDTIFGVSAGDAPHPFLVGRASLTVLTDVARARPLACLIDDAHWIDQPSLLVLAFIARRLVVDPIVLVFAARPESDALPVLAGLPGLALEGLDPDAQLALLQRDAPAIRPHVARRIARQSAGNPLSIVELVGRLSAEELLGGQAVRPRRRVGHLMFSH